VGIIYNTSMVGTTISHKSEKVGITLPVSLVKRADKARGDVPKSTFIRRAIEQFLRKEG
jgi:metal-responsive CopG/Arc/MetJ family transcriptional regulator